MGTLTNLTKRELGIMGLRIAPESTVEVFDDEKEWSNHLFVRCGWIRYNSTGKTGAAKKKAKEKSKGLEEEEMEATPAKKRRRSKTSKKKSKKKRSRKRQSEE